MRITRLGFTGFRGFGNATLGGLGELDTVLLVGPNGSGKSSVLAALASLLSGVPMSLAGNSSRTMSRLGEENVRRGAQSAEWGFGFWLGERELSWAEDTSDLPEVPYDPTSEGLLHEWSKLLRQDPLTPIDLPALSYLHSSSTLRLPPLDDEAALNHPRLAAYLGAFDQEQDHFAALERWFEQEENLENEERIRRRRLDLERPTLRAVRQAVRTFLEGLRGDRLGALQVVRAHVGGPLGDVQGRLTMLKDEVPLYLDQLSDGERRLVMLVGDVARRMAVLNPHLPDPWRSPGVMLVDEVDLHLHPAWQRRVMPALRAAFPGVQIFASTHSPQVLASVPGRSVVLMKDFTFLPGHPQTLGRDSNTLLETVFGVPERPEDVAAQLRLIYEALDEDPKRARTLLRKLNELLEPGDPELARIQTLLSLTEG